MVVGSGDSGDGDEGGGDGCEDVKLGSKWIL